MEDGVKSVTYLFIGLTIGASSFAEARPNSLPPNTMSCLGFKRLQDGEWYAFASNKPFDFGSRKQITLQDTIIKPKTMVIDEVDLYAALEYKCR